MAEKLDIKYETLKNKCAIVTGGASGLGLATAARWAEHGAYVTLVDQNEQEGQAAAKNLQAKGYHVSFVRCDTRDWVSSVAAFKHAVSFSPRKTLDIAALFAGVGGDSSNLVQQVEKANPSVSLDTDPIEADTRILDVNLDGVLKSTNLALYYFRLPAAPGSPEVAPGRKALFLISSLAGYCDYNPTLYCVSKFGVRGLFRSLRIAASDPANNFRVNLVGPGYHGTPMVMKLAEDGGPRRKAIEAAIAAGFMAPIEHVVDAATLSVTNEDVNGRSFLTVPQGFYDIMEDLEYGYGGTLNEWMETSGYKKAGFVR